MSAEPDYTLTDAKRRAVLKRRADRPKVITLKIDGPSQRVPGDRDRLVRLVSMGNSGKCRVVFSPAPEKEKPAK